MKTGVGSRGIVVVFKINNEFFHQTIVLNVVF